VEIQARTNKSFIKDLELVAAVGCVDFCRVGLTYGRRRISAMLGDVWSDVGKMSCERLSTSMLRSPDGFHTSHRSYVEMFERISNAIYT
jgi:hypothetical protein